MDSSTNRADTSASSAPRFPENTEEIPAPAVAYVAQQVKVPTEEWAAYDWARRAIKRHRVEIRVRPNFEEALKAAREIKAHAPHCRVIFTVYERKRLGRDAAELTALADHLTAHTAWSWRCSPDRCPASTTPPGRASCCSRSSPRWRRPSGRTFGSRRWRGSTPRPARPGRHP
ncbi:MULTISPECIES: DUF4158 domain-containing protein [unclassified Streptomyces]|uniref:DUF4158 domain-containing protein n=1 Tax=unclassified Streptomyces TaxID=2593676 RepID=UPI0033DBF10C